MTDHVSPAPETASGNYAAAVKPLAPGFRFHPTDEELITYYLKRKVQGKPMRFDAIGEVNVYKHEPSELAEHSRVKTKDQEWFFFCALEKKQNSPSVINRATEKGYWKKTGVDKEIKRGKKKLIGVVKTLVFYCGRAPKGNRTNWVIHEYHLVVNKLEIDSYVLCKVFRKEHAGPPTGCIYAPFSEQDWDDDDDGINEKIQQENNLQSKNVNDMKEHLRVVDIDEDNNDEPLTRECLQLSLIQYKRKRQIASFGSYNNASQAAQDHCSFPSKTGDTISPVTDTMEDNEREPPVATMVPTSSSTELINHLEKEKQLMAVERETYQLEFMSAEVMVSFLQGQVDALRVENEELKKTKTNKG